MHTMLYYRIFYVIEASSCKHIKTIEEYGDHACHYNSKISVHKLWMYIRRLWMAIRSLRMAIRSLQTEISACWPDDLGLLNGLYNDALMGSLEWCHRFRKALGHLSKNCLKTIKWSSDNSLVTLRRVAKEVKKSAQGRSNGFLMTL